MVVFLLEPFLTKPAVSDSYQPLRRNEAPLLFSLAPHIAAAVGAPPPDRIDRPRGPRSLPGFRPHDMVCGRMRIALFAKSKRRTRTTRSMARALERLGHTVCVVNERTRRRWLGRPLSRTWILHDVRRFRPDFVFIHAQDVSHEVFTRFGGEFPTVMFTPDCWDSPVEPEQLGLAAHVDLLCTVAKGQIPELERAGVKRSAYLPEAYDPALHYPVARARPAWCSDVAFIGKYSPASKVHEMREALIPPLERRFDTKLYGRGWEELGLVPTRRRVHPRQYREICRGAKIVLGCDWRHDCTWYFSNRTWFSLGCRGFLLTNYVPGLEEIFENHRHLVWYRSVDECLELIEYYIARPEERDRIAAQGHLFAREHRTYEDFARDLVDLVEGHEPRFPPPPATPADLGGTGGARVRARARRQPACE